VGKYCYDELQITFSFKNTTRGGFLTHSGVIREIGKEVNCSRPSKMTILQHPLGGFYKAQRVGTKIINTDLDKNSMKRIGISRFEFARQFNFHHPDAILNGPDELSLLEKVVSHVEHDTVFLSIPLEESTSGVDVDSWSRKVGAGFSKITNFVKSYWILTITLTTFIVCLLFVLLSIRFKNCICTFFGCLIRTCASCPRIFQSCFKVFSLKGTQNKETESDNNKPYEELELSPIASNSSPRITRFSSTLIRTESGNEKILYNFPSADNTSLKQTKNPI
jgi:hypothetical protein